MPKYLLTNEVIATELLKGLVTNTAYSEDLTTKVTVGKSVVCSYFVLRPNATVVFGGDFPSEIFAKHGWRLQPNAVAPPLFFNGSFASGDWTFKVRFESDTKYDFSVKVAVRVAKSVKADGSFATLLFLSESPNVIAIPASAGGSVTDSWTYNASVITLTNEYLFVEYRIHIEVAGKNAGAQCSFACDENPVTADESVTTTAFTPTPTTGFFALQFLSEPPSAGWNALRYENEPPTPNAWNKIKYVGE